MTLTFSSKKYSELLAKYQLKVIKTESENEKALAILEELMHIQNLTPEPETLYELLIVLIEMFEQDFYHPGSASTPDSMLRFLMEQQGVNFADLVKVIGSERVGIDLINGTEEITSEQAKILGNFF
ncbi:transcriptional regulator [Okeania sp.]|uniref:helix-turn-helix domain-containing protein n=1 Tax=Okeania sp. TaxID=3100323 RepID=UPI002B4AC97E|nr:transcriptional regulator [Okeania sp.]MEB3339605.1 transcriptional regulator [Okeania sp.]